MEVIHITYNLYKKQKFLYNQDSKKVLTELGS